MLRSTHSFVPEWQNCQGAQLLLEVHETGAEETEDRALLAMHRLLLWGVASTETYPAKHGPQVLGIVVQPARWRALQLGARLQSASFTIEIDTDSAFCRSSLSMLLLLLLAELLKMLATVE